MTFPGCGHRPLRPAGDSRNRKALRDLYPVNSPGVLDSNGHLQIQPKRFGQAPELTILLPIWADDDLAKR